jgi:hypothetical protein
MLGASVLSHVRLCQSLKHCDCELAGDAFPKRSLKEPNYIVHRRRAWLCRSVTASQGVLCNGKLGGGAKERACEVRRPSLP